MCLRLCVYTCVSVCVCIKLYAYVNSALYGLLRSFFFPPKIHVRDRFRRKEPAVNVFQRMIRIPVR